MVLGASSSVFYNGFQLSTLRQNEKKLRNSFFQSNPQNFTVTIQYPETISRGSFVSKSLISQTIDSTKDLTDSTVLRNVGVGIGHSLLSYKTTSKGISKLQINEARLSEDLDQCWEVLAEPIQTVMRRCSVLEPCEKHKELTRGKGVTKDSIRDFIKGLDIPEEAKIDLLNLTPYAYDGAAVELARTVDQAL